MFAKIDAAADGEKAPQLAAPASRLESIRVTCIIIPLSYALSQVGPYSVCHHSRWVIALVSLILPLARAVDNSMSNRPAPNTMLTSLAAVSDADCTYPHPTMGLPSPLGLGKDPPIP